LIELEDVAVETCWNLRASRLDEEEKKSFQKKEGL
jgi:hypothetical protein